MQNTSTSTRAPWLATAGMAGTLCTALAVRTIPGVHPASPVGIGIALAGIALITGVIQGRPRASVFCLMLAAILGGIWATTAALIGFSALAVIVLAVGGIALTSVMVVINHEPPPPALVDEQTGRDRPEREILIEGLLRRLTKKPVRVNRIVPWENPEDGMDVIVELPEDLTVKDLGTYAGKIAGAPSMRLRPGCIVNILGSSEFQCEAIVRVMLRDCLKDHVMLDEPATPASINDEFTVLRSPQGSMLKVCLRIFCMIVGGTTGSGKTTLLDRIIAYLVRCTDTLIWVVDFNGGGLGAPWNEAFEQGLCDRPAIDWLGDTDHESALIMAAAREVAKSRKTDRECVRLRKEKNSKVLPVSASKPAIVVLTDEGGEVRQSVGVLGQLVCSQISSLAQIGRETGVRVVMSVLRGTSDLTDKAFRAVCALRICLRMDEEGEYDHVLGRNPGRDIPLLHTGSAWVYRTTQDYNPIIGRSVDVAPDFITQHSIATAHLRPELDEAGQNICRNLTLRQVFGGRDPENYEDLLELPSMVDVANGRAYSGRHDRRRARLAAMEAGEDPNIVVNKPAPKTIGDLAGGGTGRSSATSDLSSAVRKLGSTTRKQTPPSEPRPAAVGDVDQAFQQLTAADHFLVDGVNPVDGAVDDQQREADEPPQREPVPGPSEMTLRERLRLMMSDEYPNGLTGGQIQKRLEDAGVAYSRANLYRVLGDMVERQELAHPQGDARYYLPDLS